MYASTLFPNVSPLAISTNGAGAATINCILPAQVGAKTYLEGFHITGSGATAASIVNVTITGLLCGTLNYNVVVPAGVNTAVNFAPVIFPTPLPSNAVNTTVVINIPNFGSGNTNVAVVAYGFASPN